MTATRLRRDLDALAGRHFDLVIVGGGIFGACAAWDAALRGLRVALVERRDFGGQTSAHSFKMVHGGIRYLQHGDLVRVRESCRERSALLRIAPHLVQPLPILVPTYGHGKNGKALLRLGMLAYDLLTLDRNRGIADPERRIPWGRSVSRTEVLEAYPELPREGLTGGAVFADGQMYNPPRIVLSVLRAAAAREVVMANHLEAVALRIDGGRVTGIEVEDRLGGGRFPVFAKAVLNAAGPFAERLLERWLGRPLSRPATYSRDACFVVRRRFAAPYALAVMGRSRDADAVLARDARHLFVVPWREFSLIGVWHKVYREDPDRVGLERHELESYLEEINEAYPGLGLELADIRLWHAGLLPFGEERSGGSELSYGKRSLLVDHAGEHGLEGLVTLIGIRYTMGRGDAAKAIDLVTRKLGRRLPRPPTDRLPIFGGGFGRFAELVRDLEERSRIPLAPATARALAHNYGSETSRVLNYAAEDPSLADPLPGSTVLGAEIVHGIREEMACDLADLAFRRTELATGGDPGPALDVCAAIAAREFGWSAARRRREIEDVRARFPRHARQAV